MPSNISLLVHCSDKSSHSTQVTKYLSQRYQLKTADFLKNPDLHWLNSDINSEEFSPISIEQVRQITSEMALTPFQGIGESKQAIFILCKMDQASIPAQNALLKSLEEPPAHVQFVLTSTQPQRILPTISSRCQLIELQFETHSTDDTEASEIDLKTLTNMTYTDLIELANQYKEKPEAVGFLNRLLQHLHRENTLQPTNQKTKLLQAVIVGLDYLEKNVNTRLVLEHLLFQFKTV